LHAEYNAKVAAVGENGKLINLYNSLISSRALPEEIRPAYLFDRDRVRVYQPRPKFT